MNFYKRTVSDYVFSILNGILMIFLAVITLYPFLYVLFASLSDPVEFMTYKGILLRPLSITWESYKSVLNNPNILTGYRNTFFYSALYNGGYMLPSTVLAVVVCAALMKPLSKFLNGEDLK